MNGSLDKKWWALILVFIAIVPCFICWLLRIDIFTRCYENLVDLKLIKSRRNPTNNTFEIENTEELHRKTEDLQKIQENLPMKSYNRSISCQ